MSLFAFPVKVVNQTFIPAGSIVIVGDKNETLTLRNLNTDTNLDNAFTDDSTFIGLNLPKGITFDSVTTAKHSFSGCDNLTGFKAGVTFKSLVYGEAMFAGCTALTTLPSSINFSNLQEAEEMFNGCTSLTTLPDGFNLSGLFSFYNFY